MIMIRKLHCTVHCFKKSELNEMEKNLEHTFKMQKSKPPRLLFASSNLELHIFQMQQLSVQVSKSLDAYLNQLKMKRKIQFFLFRNKNP